MMLGDAPEAHGAPFEDAKALVLETLFACTGERVDLGNGAKLRAALQRVRADIRDTEAAIVNITEEESAASATATTDRCMAL